LPPNIPVGKAVQGSVWIEFEVNPQQNRPNWLQIKKTIKQTNKPWKKVKYVTGLAFLLNNSHFPPYSFINQTENKTQKIKVRKHT
jgi:hypothetical protein